LFGSNVADLTLILALVIFFARELKIQKNILQMNRLFLFAISTPLLFGINGHYSRLEGILLVLIGILFYIYIIKKSRNEVSSVTYEFSAKNFLLLLFCMGALLASAHFTVEYGVALAQDLKVPPLLIGMFLVGLGTTLPEMFFSIKAVNKHHDGLALGDILGTVITDATILVGIMAIISPFSFAPKIAYGSAFFMFLAAAFLFYLMKTDRTLTKNEGVLLVLVYIAYAFVEFYLNT
jgi:cation:H+ antiporter